MVDPYEFIVRESVVSLSQEDVLKHIPGWEEKQEHEALLSPSQAPLSRLHGSGSSSDSSGEESEPAPTSAFCMQEPLEWASPDIQACQNNDSYNPAFESDRSRSLSPHAHYGDLWGSRLITQSQNGADMYTGFSQFTPLGVAHDLLLVDEAVKKRKEEMMLAEHCPDKDVAPVQEAKAGFELGNMSSREQREVHLQSTYKGYGQAQNYKPVESRDIRGGLKQCGVNPSMGISNLHSIGDHEKDSLSTEMLDGNGHLQNNTMTRATSIFYQIPSRESLSVPVDEQQGISVNVRLKAPSTEEARISSSTAGVADVRKRKDEGDCAFTKSSRKFKSSKEPICEQQHSKLASETNLKEVKGSRSKNHLGGGGGGGGECVEVGSSDTKSLLAFVCGNENNISAHGMGKISKAEVVKDLVDYPTDCTLVPQSVVDVIMLVSEVLPTPAPDDPDLLSIVMNTGVSLPLPFRDCIGRFICNKSTRS